MTGRGIDQVLAYPSDPVLHEPWVSDARRYVDLAEQRNGPIVAPVSNGYVWGAALETMEERHTDARIINLETGITASDDYWIEKGIHYRMAPRNIGCLTSAAVDCCVLANNHVIDWGYSGLLDTLSALSTAGISYAGAGADRDAAAAPAILDFGQRGRVLVFSFCDKTSGVPSAWGAGVDKPGVNLLKDFSSSTTGQIAQRIGSLRKDRDIVVISIHWGGNWGYEVPSEHDDFAHDLIDTGMADVIHGHSSHHPKGIEIYRGRPILYGCGDLLNDYEGISGHESWRGDLSLLYFIDFDADNARVHSMEMVPMRIEQFRLTHASAEEAEWLAATIERESKALRIELRADNTLKVIT